MAINPLMRSQPTRIMGISSGMDTDAIIQSTLRMHQFKIDNQLRTRRMIEWRQQAHTNIKNEITSIRQTFLSNLGAKSMMNRQTFNSTIATITGKNAGAVSIATTTGTPTGTIRIGQVESLAKGASISSAQSVSLGGGGFNINARLDSLNFIGGKIEFSEYQTTGKDINGNSVTIKQSHIDGATFGELTASLDAGGEKAVITKVDNDTFTISIDGGPEESIVFEDGKAEVEVGGQTFNLSKSASGDITLNGNLKIGFVREATIQIGGEDVILHQRENSSEVINAGNVLRLEGSTSITVGTKTVTINSNDTITTMLQKVNSSGANVTMSYNRLTDRFSIESNTIGSSLSSLNVSGDGNILEMLSGPNVNAVEGSMARIFINGEWVERSTNSFEYRGLRVTLNETTAEGDDDIVVNFTRDTTKAFNAIKDFIDTYNALISRLEGLLNERKTGNEVSYKPLTDEEKRGMTEKQIEEWEAIAKKGMLRSDQGIQSLVFNLRRSFFEEIEGMGITASQIGLSTGSYFGGTGGQIMIDEERLKAALEEDPDKVADIFTKIDTSGGGLKGVGLLHKIDGLMRDYVNTTQTVSVKALEDSLKRANEQIARMEQRMWAEEDRLYRQFAAMESAMSKMQQQGDWFSSMLGTSSGR